MEKLFGMVNIEYNPVGMIFISCWIIAQNNTFLFVRILELLIPLYVKTNRVSIPYTGIVARNYKNQPNRFAGIDKSY